ncbi:protein-methionine-sulfoxide reductase heme-binding subunit MsrQ [Kaistia algarum]|uniref:sulfite oxidase heme-binding subunit YedZ n=1 Tax=Kaistia algarum TaxID=2083279 RepID=UPI00140387FC|nr:protein-methionine-sulfoxide reductase heme-binding subunit MsrQ [Kaistia algarum]MCX5514603.1 sulfoxide reductase heme-binding subunit YedZ [Kaistia algarum]
MTDARATKPKARPRILPWQDRRGAFSWIRAIVFVGVFLPGLWLLSRAAAGTLGPRAMIEINHQAGLWAVRFLLLTLAVTPLRHVWQWPELVFVRRPLGVAVFAYVVIHLIAYAGDLSWDIGKVATEILARIYLAIGFLALIMLIPLAITSTDGMMRRMGGIEWRRLHVLIYPIAALAVVHFFLQSKLGVTEPIAVAVLATWLGLWRLGAAWLGAPKVGSIPGTVILGGVMIVAAGFAEAFYYGWKVHAPLGRVLATNLMTNAGTRPAWIIAAVFVAVLVVALARRLIAARQPKRERGSARRLGSEA